MDLCLRQARAFLLAELQMWQPEVFSGTAAVPPETRSIGLLARQDLAARDAVRRVLEAPALYRLFHGLLQACRPLSWLMSLGGISLGVSLTLECHSAGRCCDDRIQVASSCGSQ